MFNLTFEFLNSNFATNSLIMGIIILLGLIGATIFPISIITHLVLRSYWLALVGLRLAFEDQKPRKLNFYERYNKRLEKYLDLDHQIRRMDKLTSSVFSFSFLVLFSFLFSLVYLLTAIQLLNQFSSWLGDSFLANTLVIFLMCSLLLTSAMYAIDFFGMGLLKTIQKKWFQNLYYPIYRFYSVITFASLYRGIYYKLATQVSKRVVMTVLPLYVLLTLILINIGYNSYLFYPSDHTLDEGIDQYMYLSSSYRDELTDQHYVSRPLIQSRIPSDDHIRLFIPLSLSLEDSLKNHCDGIVPFDAKGFHWSKNFTISGLTDLPDSIDAIENTKAILQCLAQQIEVSVNDSTYDGLQYKYATLTTPEKSGVEVLFSIKWLETGNHFVNISSNAFYGDRVYHIPFWRD